MKRGTRILLIVVAAVVLLFGGVAVTHYVMMGGNMSFHDMMAMHGMGSGEMAGHNHEGGDQIPKDAAHPGAQRVEATVTIKQWKMEPDTLSFAQGTRLVLTVKNDSSSTMPHHFAIPGLGLRLVEIPPGETRTVELNLDQPGSLAYLCDIPGHEQMGQKGTLTITEKK